MSRQRDPQPSETPCAAPVLIAPGATLSGGSGGTSAHSNTRPAGPFLACIRELYAAVDRPHLTNFYRMAVRVAKIEGWEIVPLSTVRRHLAAMQDEQNMQCPPHLSPGTRSTGGGVTAPHSAPTGLFHPVDGPPHGPAGGVSAAPEARQPLFSVPEPMARAFELAGIADRAATEMRQRPVGSRPYNDAKARYDRACGQMVGEMARLQDRADCLGKFGG